MIKYLRYVFYALLICLLIFQGSALISAQTEATPYDIVIRNGRVLDLSLIHISEPTRPY